MKRFFKEGLGDSILKFILPKSLKEVYILIG